MDWDFHVWFYVISFLKGQIIYVCICEEHNGIYFVNGTAKSVSKYICTYLYFGAVSFGNEKQILQGSIQGFSLEMNAINTTHFNLYFSNFLSVLFIDIYGK